LTKFESKGNKTNPAEGRS